MAEGKPKLLQYLAPADPRGVVRGLHHPWHRSYRAARSIRWRSCRRGTSRRWRAHHAQASLDIPAIPLIGIVKKNGIMLVDVALEEQRDHGPLRGGDPSRMPPPLPAHSDDNDVRAVRRRSAHARNRNRVRNPAAARLCDRRRIAGVPGAHALHHASRLHLHGQDRSGLVGAELRQALPSCRRDADRLSDYGNCLLPAEGQSAARRSCSTRLILENLDGLMVNSFYGAASSVV